MYAFDDAGNGNWDSWRWQLLHKNLILGHSNSLAMSIRSNSGSNSEKAILKAIARINFTELRALIIYQNEIESIEGIARMQMPFLDSLSMRTSS